MVLWRPTRPSRKESESEVAQSCPTLCDPMNCSLPGSSVHGIFQARVLEWVAISFSRGSSQLRDWTLVSHIAGRRFNLWATREALQDLLKLTPKRYVVFIIGDWNAKIGSQEIPGITGKFGLGVQNEAGQRLRVLPIECTGHRTHPLPTTQEMTLHMDITRWSIAMSDWLYYLQPKMEELYTVNKNKIGSWLWLRSWTPYC